MQGHGSGHVEGDIRTLGSRDSERLARVAQVAVQLVLARVDHDGLAVRNSLDRRVQRLVLRLADGSDSRCLALADVGTAAALVLTGGLGVAGSSPHRVVIGRVRLLDDHVTGFAGASRGVHRRRQQRKHHYQRKQQ